jgi:hypothetical protein
VAALASPPSDVIDTAQATDAGEARGLIIRNIGV